ncbi:MAG TPA: hypothetical protein VKE96_26325 [Vicinamibacterales bacterium]|nr:hypothetical protein [Vicinamibacterales bacterium]
MIDVRTITEVRAALFTDETRAVEPLELWSRDEAAAAETYPSALQA